MNTLKPRLLLPIEVKRVKELLEYCYIDGSHHKQYALVEIAKVIYMDDFADEFADVNGGIPG